jgi:hypothetical protein
MGNTIAIHQPNFFPWLGFFTKILAADHFVILDDAQLQKTGGGWTNRTRVIVSAEARWITAAIDRAQPGVRTVAQSTFADTPWRDKIVRTLTQSYAKAPHFQESSELLLPLVTQSTSNIADYNIRSIVAICEMLGINTSCFVRSSSLRIETTATRRLIDIVRKLGAEAYLSGDGAQGYQVDELFRQSGVSLSKLGFIHPEYRQGNERHSFVPGLSIIDALMNVGIRATRTMLDEAVEASRTSCGAKKTS